MVKLKNFSLLFISVFCVFTLGSSAEVNGDRKNYIVYMGSTSDTYSVTNQHINILQQVVEGIPAEETIVRTYSKSFNGFAARLTQKEYQNLKGMKEVVSVFPSRTLQLQTTRSWDFLGVPANPTPKQQNAESNVIIGVIDTGIWPESESFNDVGLGPIPKKWKGVCRGGKDFTCNKKVIGARLYVETSTSARDDVGHGSHTASTAAGRKVENVSFSGIAKGTARGAVPSARIAVYKVCDSLGCQETDILKAFDDAIADGVDLITISVGGDAAQFYADGIAIGSFHAMVRGILTVQSAGNDGDASASIGSVAPWLLSVAASTTDRRIIDKVVLGNGQTLLGNTVNEFTLKGNKFPLVYGKDVTTSCDEATAKTCLDYCLDESLVKGKIVVCDDTAPFAAALRSGALGVLATTRFENVSFVSAMPGASLNDADVQALKLYLKSARAPTANILKSETVNDTNAPVVAKFSSRGPNPIASDILKPDITAPGVDILAAFSPIGPVTETPEDKRSVTYSVLSGTSMACPHVAGAAAYLKSVHPDWSPAAIKSSLMTTADVLSPANNPEAEFAYGSGQINPIKAADPGLVYEVTQDDYLTFLCKSGYDKDQIGQVSGNTKFVCPPKTDVKTPKDVNYPSMSANVVPDRLYIVKFSRTVTNIGAPTSTYTAKVTSGAGMNVTVVPNSLSFKSLKENKSFTVTVMGKPMSSTSLVSAAIVWSDGVHTVRSPIIVYTS